MVEMVAILSRLSLLVLSVNALDLKNADGCRRTFRRGLSTREGFLAKAAVATGSFLGFLPVREAEAAGPVTVTETDSLGAMAKRAIRPKPPKLLRRKLSQDFAVLLMRSSYNALDQIDCVAMVC